MCSSDLTKPLLNKIGRQVFENFALPTALWEIKKTFLFGSQNRQGFLDAIIDEEIHHPLPQGFKPSAFEQPFGESPLSLSHPDFNHPLKLKGTIDLVLQDNAGRIMVLDYKTGAVLPIPKDIETLRAMQLPLYLIAIKHLYPQSEGVAGMYFQLRDAKDLTKTTPIVLNADIKKEFGLTRNRPILADTAFYTRIINHLFQLQTLMHNGFFGLTHRIELTEAFKNRDKKCKSCAFKLSCRYPGRFQS